VNRDFLLPFPSKYIPRKRLSIFLMEILRHFKIER